MKFFASAVVATFLVLFSAVSSISQADDRFSLETGIASAQYLQSFSAQAVGFLQGTSPSFPVFDPAAARGQSQRGGQQLPPCDRGGNWYPVNEEGTQFVCIDADQTRYCPRGTTVVALDYPYFYCQLSYPNYDYFKSDDVLEMDGLAVEGLKWFNRSQAHAALKFQQALQSLLAGDFGQMQFLKNEGCGQYNESSVALGATRLPANLQPVGFVNSALLDDMNAALQATAAVVCPK